MFPHQSPASFMWHRPRGVARMKRAIAPGQTNYPRPPDRTLSLATAPRVETTSISPGILSAWTRSKHQPTDLIRTPLSGRSGLLELKVPPGRSGVFHSQVHPRYPSGQPSTARTNTGASRIDATLLAPTPFNPDVAASPANPMAADPH